jgi:hypothetical protein
MTISENAADADDPATAGAMNGVARSYQARARYAEAEPLYLRRAHRDADALEMDERAREIRTRHAQENQRR